MQSTLQKIYLLDELAPVNHPGPLALTPAATQPSRPGGYQPVALHMAGGTLYVVMHAKAYEGSHKNPADEIWVDDMKSKARLARVKTPHATGLAVSQGEAPRLFAFNTEGASVTAFDGGRKLKKVDAAVGFGDTPTQMEVQ